MKKNPHLLDRAFRDGHGIVCCTVQHGLRRVRAYEPSLRLVQYEDGSVAQVTAHTLSSLHAVGRADPQYLEIDCKFESPELSKGAARSQEQNGK